MAGTAFQAKAVVVAPTDDRTSYGSGKALTQAEAEAELKDILKTVVGKSIQKVTISFELDATALATYALSSAVAQYEDVDLVLERIDAVLGPIAKTRFIENMNLSYKLASRPEVNVGHADIIAIATAYRDGDGVGGYAASPFSKFRL